jgi:hypothetical protein
MKHPFDETELTELFEVARISLNDFASLEHIASKMDLSDEYMIKLRDKLHSFMNEDNPKKYFKTVFKVEVLSEGQLSDVPFYLTGSDEADGIGQIVLDSETELTKEEMEEEIKKAIGNNLSL